MLRELGFQTNVEALYLALVDNPALTVNELAELGVVAEDDLPTALETLESAGLIHQLASSPRRYAAVDPELGLVGVVVAQEQALNHARATARRLTERFRAARRGRDPLDVIDVVVGHDAQGRRFDQLQRLVEAELRGFDKPPYITGALAVNDLLLERLGEGIRVRALYDSSSLQVPGAAAGIRRFRDAGEQQRVMDGVPLKMIIADEKLALIRLTSDSTTASSSLYVHPSALLDGLCQLFETLWRFATPLQAGEADAEIFAEDQPSPEESRFLGLLAAGMTDEGIGRYLNVSPRTVQRNLRAIMDRLGAHTRFQAGLQAKRRNWL
jgi:sugar-specific transcriptional regulator TrmB/DNA-binding CsgD family transcriptional regulator